MIGITTNLYSYYIGLKVDRKEGPHPFYSAKNWGLVVPVDASQRVPQNWEEIHVEGNRAI